MCRPAFVFDWVGGIQWHCKGRRNVEGTGRDWKLFLASSGWVIAPLFDSQSMKRYIGVGSCWICFLVCALFLGNTLESPPLSPSLFSTLYLVYTSSLSLWDICSVSSVGGLLSLGSFDIDLRICRSVVWVASCHSSRVWTRTFLPSCLFLLLECF